jgi:two-component system, LuxR family, sensor kinase FixL
MSGTMNGGRAEAFEALRESEELHRATLSNISDAVFLADDAGMFTFICPNVDVIFGYVPDEVRAMSRLGRLLGDNLFDPHELDSKGEIRNLEREIVAKSGERRTVLIHLKRVSIQGGTVLCTCRDISDLKIAERELAATQLNLAHAARLALVGQLMASIVHEIQQPLTSVSLNASTGLQLLHTQAQFPDPQELRDILHDIHEQSTAASDIIDRLRAIVRKRPIELRALDANEVAQDVLKLVRMDALRRGVTLRAELAPSPVIVDADRVSLQQMILDLILNAMDAIDQLEGERLVVVETRKYLDHVLIAVTDNGCGIPVADRSKIFEAFFTTKADGIGLGLAIARAIAETHGGYLRAEEPQGRGARFCLTLPLPRALGDRTLM